MRSFVALTLFAAAAVAEPQCVPISDPAGKLWTQVEAFMGTDKVAPIKSQVIGVVNMLQLAPLDTCLGSINLMAAAGDAVALMGSEECKASLNFATTSPDIQVLTEKGSTLLSNFSTKEFGKFIAYVVDIQNGEYEAMCQVVEASFTPCVLQQLMPVLHKVLTQFSSGCCKPFLTLVEEMFGQRLDVLVSDLVMHLGNNLCAVRSPGLVVEKERCAQSIVRSYLQKGLIGMTKNLMGLVEIPNEGACDAFTGLPFHNTRNVLTKLAPKNPVDCCSTYASEMFSYVRDFPIIQEAVVGNVQLSSLFADGECVKGDEIAALVPEAFRNTASMVLAAKCVRIPTGYSQNCDYKATCSAIVHPDAGTDVPTDAPTDEPTAYPTPTDAPTDVPTDEPTKVPCKTDEPTKNPCKTDAPTEDPCKPDAPTEDPCKPDEPTEDPCKPRPPKTDAPTSKPTYAPTSKPTTAPTTKPTNAPKTKAPGNGKNKNADSAAGHLVVSIFSLMLPLYLLF